MTDEQKRELWDQKYKDGLPSLTRPDPFFLFAYRRFVEKAFQSPGIALDLAGGLGRHALWLASKKWQVSVVDLSEVAIWKLRQVAIEQNVSLDLLALDAARYQFEPGHFDLILLFYHLDRELFPKIVSALKPGGLFICKTHVLWDSIVGEGLAISNLLKKQELVSLVPELRIMSYEERPVRDRGVAEFVGQKRRPKVKGE